MFTETSLQKLKDFSAQDPVVSLYLNTEPTHGNAETHRLRLRNLLKDIPLEKDVENIEKFFNYSYDWSGRSVAIFSCAPAGLFQSFPLAVPVKDFIQIGSKAALDPLEQLLEEYSNLGVALVDSQGARLFHFHLGEMVEQQGVMGEEVKHIKSGSSSSTHGLRGGSPGGGRGMNETIDRNLREIAGFATRFFESNRVRRIMIGGTDDNVSHFRGYLPRTLQSLVIGSFAMSMTASHADVLNKITRAVMED